jgi:hypothetical protein
MKHTPGPWVRDGWSISDQKNRTVICNVVPWDSSGCRVEDISNANLITTAPELLEALERMVGVCAGYLENQLPSDADLYNPGYVSPLSQARDAIKKAKGRPE